MGDGIHNAAVTVGAFLPKLGAFLLIVLATWLVAMIVSAIVTKLLTRLGADRLVAKNEYGRQAMAKTKGGVGGLFGTIAKVAIWLIGLSLAFNVFGPNPVSSYLAAMVAFIPRIITAVAIVALALWVASVVRNLLRSVLGGVSYGDTVATFVGAFIAVFGVLAALSQLDVAPAIVNAVAYAALLAVAGVVVVGVGGGLIQPMRERWSRTLDKVESDAPVVKASAQAKAHERAQERAARESAFPAYPAESASPSTIDLTTGAAAPRVPATSPAGYGTNAPGAAHGPFEGTVPIDPAVGGAPRPAGYSPEGYRSPDYRSPDYRSPDYRPDVAPPQ